MWVVNKGFKQWTGEGIVDQIMSFQKTIMYLPHMSTCFNQWIALREIHPRLDRQHLKGRVRCAVRISPEVLGPEYHLVEQGWDPERKWEAHKIIEVRQLHAQQSAEGKPWRVYTTDEYLAETAKLLGAIQMGITIHEPMVGVMRTLGARTKERNLETQNKQDPKKQRE